MSAAATKKSAFRRYAFACTQCRRKKLRCGGEQPTCQRCRQNNDACHYGQRAAESSLVESHARIEQLEAELARARRATSHLTETRQPDTSSLHLRGNEVSQEEHESTTPRTSHADEQDLCSSIGLDENGQVTYHGPTSRFSDACGLTKRCVEQSPKQVEETQREHIAVLNNNRDQLSEVWTSLIQHKTAQDFGAEPDLVHRLLDWYWTWHYPLHNYLYKPCFIMDMALGGPYYSKFLLHCILALSARHLDASSIDFEAARNGEIFLSSAKELLMEELGSTKPKIPTIQGLLIISGRQCGVGKTSEGWLYTGMAIRMMTDLGLHLNLRDVAHLEKLAPVELEVRKRLYCSAYIWDKSLSLSLGRAPTLNRIPPAALELLDHADDHQVWRPPEHPEFPGALAYQTTCFKFFCRLGPIIELIMLPPPKDSSTVFMDRLRLIQAKLQAWYNELPVPLRMDPSSGTCPPPYILSLNVLYHTLQIILWRPFLKIRDIAACATSACINSARTVHDLLMVYGRTFQLRKVSYLLSYCVYIVATVQVYEMRVSPSEQRSEAAQRLAVSLQILESESRQTPGIRRSIEILKRQLRDWAQDGADEPTSKRAAENVSCHHRAGPAFDTQHSNDTANNISTNFPHNQIPAADQYQPSDSWQWQANQIGSNDGTNLELGFAESGDGLLLPYSFDDTLYRDFFASPYFDEDAMM